MARTPPLDLTRRERQIMDIVYREGRVSAARVLEQLPDPPSYSAVRALLRVLVEKGHLRHERQGARYLYVPTRRRERVRGRALDQVVQTFFEGSAAQAVAALLDQSAARLSDAELDRLAELIDRARKEGR